MNKHFSILTVVAILILILTSCTMPTAMPTLPPSGGPGQPGQSGQPGAPAPAGVAAAPPPMQVGSTFQYVDGSILVAVPAGSITVGKKDGTDNPATQITLSDFWIYRTKVTNQEYAFCVTSGKCTPPDLNDDQGYNDVNRVNEPVTGVSWDQANAYCTFVHGQLPTEWQLEKTGRGPDANPYPWGDEQPSCDQLNFNNCVGRTTDVNTYPQGKSYYDAFDMAGNAFEWAADWYDELYYPNMPTQDPPGPANGTQRSVRSSSYESSADQVALFARFYEDPTTQRRDLGFRCVVNNPNHFAPACELIAYVGLNAPGSGNHPLAIPTPDCPNVSVNTAGYCNKNVNPHQPYANLDFGPNPLPAILAPGMPVIPAGCTGGPYHYDCTGGGIAQIQAVCPVPPATAPAGCDPGFTETPPGSGTCVWTGGFTGATECLPGMTFDPARQCCSSTPGTNSFYQLCPSFAPYFANGVCVPWPGVSYGPLRQVIVSLGSCGGSKKEPGGNETQGCGTWPNCNPGCDQRCLENVCTCEPANP